MRITAFYAHLWTAMSKLANDCGYALALHGSMARDLDIIAIPWTDDCDDADMLIKKLIDKFEFSFPESSNTEKLTTKLYGRKAYVLMCPAGGGHYIDLSIMPKHDEAERLTKIFDAADNVIDILGYLIPDYEEGKLLELTELKRAISEYYKAVKPIGANACPSEEARALCMDRS